VVAFPRISTPRTPHTPPRPCERARRCAGLASAGVFAGAGDVRGLWYRAFTARHATRPTPPALATGTRLTWCYARTQRLQADAYCDTPRSRRLGMPKILTDENLQPVPRCPITRFSGAVPPLLAPRLYRTPSRHGREHYSIALLRGRYAAHPTLGFHLPHPTATQKKTHMGERKETQALHTRLRVGQGLTCGMDAALRRTGMVAQRAGCCRRTRWSKPRPPPSPLPCPRCGLPASTQPGSCGLGSTCTCMPVHWAQRCHGTQGLPTDTPRPGFCQAGTRPTCHRPALLPAALCPPPPRPHPTPHTPSTFSLTQFCWAAVPTSHCFLPPRPPMPHAGFRTEPSGRLADPPAPATPGGTGRAGALPPHAYPHHRAFRRAGLWAGAAAAFRIVCAYSRPFLNLPTLAGTLLPPPPLCLPFEQGGTDWDGGPTSLSSHSQATRLQDVLRAAHHTTTAAAARYRGKQGRHWASPSAADNSATLNSGALPRAALQPERLRHAFAFAPLFSRVILQVWACARARLTAGAGHRLSVFARRVLLHYTILPYTTGPSAILQLSPSRV